MPSVATTKRRCYLLPVNGKPSEPFAANAEEEITRFCGCQESDPLHTKGLLSGNFCRQIIFGELNIGLRTTDEWRGGRTWRGLPPLYAFVVVCLKSGVAVGSCRKRASGTGVGAKELRSRDKSDARVRKLRMKTIEAGNNMSRLSCSSLP